MSKMSYTDISLYAGTYYTQRMHIILLLSITNIQMPDHTTDDIIHHKQFTVLGAVCLSEEFG